MKINIKFRAWDKKRKFMIVIFDNLGREEWYLPNLNENYEIMQYTGFNDKNNKEIYEGDILKFKNTPKYGVVDYCNEWGAYVVKYLENKEKVILGMTYKKEDMEVASNIWGDREI